MIRVVSLFLFLLTFSNFVWSQKPSEALKPRVWKKVMKDVSYAKAPKEKAKETNTNSSQQNAGNQAVERREQSRSKRVEMSKTVQSVLQVIGIVVLVFFIVWVIVRIKTPTKLTPVLRNEAVSLEEAEENLPSVSLNNIYQEALDSKDLRRAFRIKFLMILQELLDQNYIFWKKSKTNVTYQNEIQIAFIHSKFSAIVSEYDDIWYGEKVLTETMFQQVLLQIEDIITSIQRGEIEQ